MYGPAGPTIKADHFYGSRVFIPKNKKMATEWVSI
jgi:hypothetical protein